MFDADRIGPVTACRAARAISRDSVIASDVGAIGINSANGNGRGLISWRMNPTVHLRVACILTIVSSGSDNHNAQIDQRAHSPANRIILVRINRRHAKTHVDHADVVLTAVSHDGVESRQNSRRCSQAL